MNFIKKTFAITHNIVNNFALTRTIASNFANNFVSASDAFNMFQARYMSSLNQMHRTGPHYKNRKVRRPLEGKPFAKGVILKTLIKAPRKPNSANRKCVLVKLSTGKTKFAYIPGIGHNLQEHNIVLVRCGGPRDVPGVNLTCVRGVYDLPHVIRKPMHKK